MWSGVARCLLPAAWVLAAWLPTAAAWGDPRSAAEPRLPYDVAAIVVSGVLTALAGYFLLLFVLHRRETEYLWLGLLVGDFAALSWLGGGAAGAAMRWDAVLAHGGAALFVAWAGPRLPRRFARWGRLFGYSHGVLAAASAVVPPAWIDASETLRWLWGLPLLAILLPLLRQGLERPEIEERIADVSILAVPLAVAAEHILSAGGVPSPLPLPGTGYLLWAGAVWLAVSSRFSRAHQELDRFRHQLEKMAEERTDELTTTHRRLESQVGERRLMEGAMRLLERAVEQSIDGIAVTDMAGSTQFLNEAWARLHGYEVFEVLGYDLTLFHTPEQMQEQVYPLMAKVRDQGAFEGEVWHRRKDGKVFPTWMSVTRLQDAEDRAVGMVIIARDVSERRKAAEERLRLESKLLQAEKLESLAKLAAGIAHDYNNLLTGILGNTSRAAAELAADPIKRGQIDRIEAAAEQAARLSDQLLACAGEDRLSFKIVELNPLVESAREELVGIAPPEIELDLHLNEGLPQIEADPVQLSQVMINLVRNACESIDGDRGVVAVRTSKVRAERAYFEGAFLDEGQPPGDYAVFEVTDTGCGIDDDTRIRLFDPFFSTKGRSRGLGLATALGIVRAHKGAIKVYSQVGRGTTFEVLFPATAKRPEAEVSEQELQQWKGRGRVLVVDDEPLVLEVSKEILEYHDFDVLTATDGREAVEVYRRLPGQFRAVVLDQTMPVMGGAEAFREIRAIDPDAVVLLMSGFSARVGKQLAAEGLAGFLPKPFRPSDLVRKVREVLEESEPPSAP